MKARFALAAVAAAALLGAGGARADVRMIELGPRLSLDLNNDSHVALGAEARFGLYQIAPTVRFDLRPTFDYYFYGGGTNAFDLSGDALFAFDVQSEVVEPYALGGLGIFHYSFDNAFGSDSTTKLGLNLGGGAKFLPRGKVQPFVEIRATVGFDGSPVVLTGGVLFILQ